MRRSSSSSSSVLRGTGASFPASPIAARMVGLLELLAEQVLGHLSLPPQRRQSHFQVLDVLQGVYHAECETK